MNPNTPLSTIMGDKSFRIFTKLKDGKYNSFQGIIDDFYQSDKPVPFDHFIAPAEQLFGWLRVEFIPRNELLFKVFEPIANKLETISRFGNTWISGPRGCGKSHYLRILNFFPNVIVLSQKDKELTEKLKNIDYDFKKRFGILFACRLGEFKEFDPEIMERDKFDKRTQKFLKHILILKIWNKTLQSIKKGLETKYENSNDSVIKIPTEFNDLLKFLENKLGSIAIINDVNPHAVFQQVLDACILKENSATSVWYMPEKRPRITTLLNEKDLDQFFEIIKSIFSDLTEAKFYILVDDASENHIHFEIQKILNSLIFAVQSHHCFKITFDKFMYTLDTADGRSIDPRHDVTYEDLGEISISTTQRNYINEVSKYMAKVVNKRLEVANYKNSIEKILGQSQRSVEFLRFLASPRVRKPSKSKQKIKKKELAYYAGWNIVWQLSHGSVRTLLELIEHIFNVNKVSDKTEFISLKDQDKAVRSYSLRQFKSLTMLPGAFDGEPIGSKLQSIISAIGAISRQYLTKFNTGDPNRWYETISIDRLDKRKLSPSTQKILMELVKYGLLLDDSTNFSRAQFGLLQRYDLNKIFAPAFQITFRVRNHMYVSNEKLEALINRPDDFVNHHRNKLNSLVNKAKYFQEQLFDESDE